MDGTGTGTEATRPPRRRWAGGVGLAAALLAAGAVGAGATALAGRGHGVTVVALAPAPVAAMRDGGQVAIRGQVAEVFGGRFVLDDGSGRALVETGPAGDRAPLVKEAETVTVQGRFDHGAVHALAVQHADGRTDMAGPPGPPPPPPGPGPR